MSVERTREAMNRYWSSEHQDVSMMADEVVFTHMATRRGASGAGGGPADA
jgi:hypothetical protein